MRRHEIRAPAQPNPRPSLGRSRPICRRRRRTPLSVWLLAAAVAPLPLSQSLHAELYRVELVGGGSFDSRYLPIEDPVAPERVLLLTDVGNWVSLPRRVIRRVTVDIETRGFGRRLDAQTIAVGPAMNDAAAPSAGRAASDDPVALLTRLFERRFEALPLANVEQFVEPEHAAGIPLSYSLGSVPQVGSAERFVTPQDRP
jgi:hypothetical protein